MNKSNKNKRSFPRLILLKDVFSTLEWISYKVSRLAGSWTFIFLHAIWMFFWFYLDLSLDLFTLILSIEAIVLASILLMSSNQQYKIDSAREEEDYHVDLYTAHEIGNIKESILEIRKDLKEIKQTNEPPKNQDNS